VLTCIAAAILTVAAAPNPTRTALGNSVISQRDPRVRVVLPRDARYAGADRWVLFGIANCELFAFVRADRKNRVRALYWVQFESYLPSMPRLHHVYASKRPARLGGLDFYVDTWTEHNAHGIHPPDTKALAAAIRAKGYSVPAGIHGGSDEQHLYALLQSRGYRMPPDIMSVRFVHLVDAQRRKELMIIYSEPLSAAGQGTLVSRAQRQIGVVSAGCGATGVRYHACSGVSASFSAVTLPATVRFPLASAGVRIHALLVDDARRYAAYDPARSSAALAAARTNCRRRRASGAESCSASRSMRSSQA